MSDMKLVIKIPKKVYKAICEKNALGCDIGDIKDIIRNGTPLPKNHGKLIDADEIQFERSEFNTYRDYCIAFDAIDQTDAIIEAEWEYITGKAGK